MFAFHRGKFAHLYNPLNRVDRPKLINENGTLGYTSDEVAEYMKNIGKFEEWRNWFMGSTGMITKKGKFLVYKYDFDRFLEGLPNED